MEKHKFTSQDEISSEDQDEPNKHSNNYNNNIGDGNFHNASSKKMLLSSDESLPVPTRINHCIPSPRKKHAKFSPEARYNIDGIMCDSRIFISPKDHGSVHVCISSDFDKEAAFSKSLDCSIECYENQSPNKSPLARSVSEDFLRRPRLVLERRISMVSSGKGKLMGISKVLAGDKTTRSPSNTSQPGLGASSSEEIVRKKSKFTTEQKLIAFSLCLVDFTAFLAMSLIAPFFPREAEKKGMRESLSGFVFSIYALVVMLTSPIFGKIVPKCGAKFMFLSGIGFSGVCNILFGVLDRVDDTTTFTVLCFLVRSFEAVGAAAFCTASCTILIDQFPDDIGTVFGFTETCMGIGMSIGPAIGGALYAAGGFGLPFFTLGGFVVMIVPLCWYLLRNVKDPEQILTSSVSYKKLLSMPHVLIVCIILAVVSQAQGFIDPTLEPHMRQYNLDASIIGLLFLLLSGSYALFSPIIGFISSKVENKYPIMIVGLLFVSLSLMLLGPSDFLPFDGSVWISVIALVLLGISLAAAYIPTFESMFIAAMNGGLEDDINTYSVVSGLWNSVFSLGEVTGPTLGGVLSDFFTFPQASSLMAFCTLGAFVIAILSWFNPFNWCGPYSLIEDAEDKMVGTSEDDVEEEEEEESSSLQQSKVHSYGSVWDGKDPLLAPDQDGRIV